jgi:hypothetical protein
LYKPVAIQTSLTTELRNIEMPIRALATLLRKRTFAQNADNVRSFPQCLQVAPGDTNVGSRPSHVTYGLCLANFEKTGRDVERAAVTRSDR